MNQRQIIFRYAVRIDDFIEVEPLQILYTVAANFTL